ncbi:MAG: phospholipid carrier-dependent glycosyltransferase [Proteobacteria bacterium]|nr:phospholipid carrier-dependent glycosyltransferase [Pseudomonadota bacterium]
MRVSHLRQGTDPCPLVRIRACVRYHWSVQAPPQHNPSESRPRQSPSSAWALATLLVITALGLTFRLWDLGTLPPSPDPDELSIGYNAWSILETGRDEFGTPYPTAFRAFGEYKRPAFIYAAVPSIALFGPTTWAIRLPGAIAGTLTVPVLYALAVSLFGNRAIGLLAATGLAFSPWHLQFSRGAREAAFITLAVTLLALCLTRATTLILGTSTTGVLPRRVHVWAAGASLAMLLAMYSYPGGVVFTPLMVGASAWILRSHLRRTALSWVIAIAIVGVGAFPLARQLLDGRVGARFAQASLLNDVDLQKLATKRIERDVQLGIPWILDHPYALAARRAVDAYAGHFNPTYLFTRGDDQPRHHGTDTGQLYLWDAPLILAGLVILARRRTHPAYQFTGLWLLIGPVPASLATEAPHAVRSIVMLPAWYLAGGIGAVAIWNRLRPTRNRGSTTAHSGMSSSHHTRRPSTCMPSGRHGMHRPATSDTVAPDNWTARPWHPSGSTPSNSVSCHGPMNRDQRTPSTLFSRSTDGNHHHMPGLSGKCGMRAGKSGSSSSRFQREPEIRPFRTQDAARK